MTHEQAPITGNLRGGWTPVYREVWTHYLPVIGKDALLYYLYLLDRRMTNPKDPRFGKAWPGRNTVAQTLGIAKKTLATIDAKLVGAGLVEIERVPIGGGRVKVQYTVHDPLSADEIDVAKMTEMVARETTLVAEVTITGSVGNPINNYISRSKDQDLEKDIATPSKAATEKSISEYKAPDITKYFCAKYKERYGDDFVIKNYAATNSQVKSKLLANFSAEKIVAMIDVAIERYEYSRWKSPQYPRPTVAFLVQYANDLAALVASHTPEPAPEPQLTYAELAALGRL
jgi:hypothetical protein